MESLVPLTLRSALGLVVLAGDPMQQSATPRSGLVQHVTHGRSLIERLLQSETYSASTPEQRMKVFLTANYRSHPNLLQLPSAMFYDGKLTSKANESAVSRLLPFHMVPAADPYPLLFVGVDGKHSHEPHSLSLVTS